MSVIVKDPEILGGMPVFAGTRVPVKNLFDALICGESVPEFLDDFPTVTLEQVQAVLAEAEQGHCESCRRVTGRRVIAFSSRWGLAWMRRRVGLGGARATFSPLARWRQWG